MCLPRISLLCTGNAPVIQSQSSFYAILGQIMMEVWDSTLGPPTYRTYIFYTEFTTPQKLDFVHVHTVLFQISLCALHRLIRDDTFIVFLVSSMSFRSHCPRILSQIILSNSNRLNREDTIRFYGFFVLKEVSCKRKFSPDGKCRSWLACEACTG